MKKIFTLILALMAFVMGSQTVRAEATKTMEVTVESGMDFYDEENKDVRFALTLLYNLGQLSFTETQQIVSTKTGKVLLTVSEEGIIVVSSDVTSDDDIFYTFTDADREYFKEEDIEEEMAPYAAIKVHFVAGSGGGGNVDLTALSGTIRNGMNFDDDENTYFAFFFLRNYFNQIKMEYELDEEGKFTGNILFSSKADKLLFIMNDDNIITIADGVTSADDIIYTITQEDRNKLLEMEDFEAYKFIAPYKTVQLHFDTSGGGSTDLLTYEGTLKSGINLYAQENEQLNLAINALAATNYLTEFLNSGHSGPKYEEEMSLMYFLTETNKHLFSVSPEGIVTLSDDLSAADDISYVITEADRKVFKEKGYADGLAPYSTIKLHFQTGLIATLKTGINTSDAKNEETLMAMTLMLYYFNQLQMNYDEETGGATFLSMAGKELFTMNNNSFVTLAPGITSDDDIVYTITREDREGLKDTYKELYDYLSNYNTVEIRFAPQTQTLEAILRDGTDLTDENNQQILKVIQLLVNSFNMLTTGYADGMDAVYSPTDKLLFTVTDKGIANVSQDLRVGDNVVYTVTEEDRESLYNSDRDAYELLLDYKAIALYFNYNDPVGIKRIDNGQLTTDNEGAWYSLDGRRLDIKPTQKGIYIKGGRKIVVK